MKKIDKLLITSFIPPFILTFFIAVFVLIMQFLWAYIDEIIGKGVGGLLIFELLFYRAMALVPMALPIATLISSVMVMGNLGERYELASMKSAGIPLIRVMMPLFGLSILIAGFSFVSANWLIPYSNLKFKSRLYDIRKQKPTLSIKEGTFNGEMTGFVLRVGKKEKDEKTLHDILIYDHSGNRVNDKMVQAHNGEMTYSKNRRFLLMKLKSGNSYEDLANRNNGKQNQFPYLRTTFDDYDLVFDMQQFENNKTPEEAFKNHQSMMTLTQLLAAIDSLEHGRVRRLKILQEYLQPYFYYKTKTQPPRTFAQVNTAATPDNFIELLPVGERAPAANRAMNLARNVTDYYKSSEEDLMTAKQSLREHWLELHRKFSMAFACLMFLFIGAPMGAIIRKGGFGWPILVSILFFVLFVVLSIVGEKLGKDGAIVPFLASWFPNMIMTPISLFITWQAMQDSSVLNIDACLAFAKKVWGFFKKDKTIKI